MGLDEGVFAYLPRTRRASMASVRDVLERWFAEVPNSHADGIRARIQSGDDEQFESAYWEMFLATLLARRGYALTWEPEVPGTAKRPDFLVARGDDVFYVEARAIGSKKAALAERRRTTKAYESIRAWDLPNFFLGLTLEAVGATDLRIADFKKVVKPWLDGLDPDAVLAAQAQSNFFEVPHKSVSVGTGPSRFTLFRARPTHGVRARRHSVRTPRASVGNSTTTSGSTSLFTRRLAGTATIWRTP